MNIDWRDLLVRYMAHVGHCEGIFFTSNFEHNISTEKWEDVIAEASLYLSNWEKEHGL